MGRIDMVWHAASRVEYELSQSQGGRNSERVASRKVERRASSEARYALSRERHAMGRTQVQIDLLDLFPPASTSASAPVPVDAASIAFVGPLPAAAPLHLALNHLRRGEEDDNDDETSDCGDCGLSERARGKLRAAEEESDIGTERDGASHPTPSVASPPSFAGRAGSVNSTLQRRVLLLTPNRNVLRQQLVEQCDDSLVGDKLDGPDQALLDRIDMRCVLAHRLPELRARLTGQFMAQLPQLPPYIVPSHLFPLDCPRFGRPRCSRSLRQHGRSPHTRSELLALPSYAGHTARAVDVCPGTGPRRVRSCLSLSRPSPSRLAPLTTSCFA